ncbi:hypothetical protein LBBP_02325 [Leptospira borgpetersenii serovar Ballum]|uniref:Uncharacterized protein n=1 Tax=Leptospira borgpetersenii serovar Ballum TaxID=280505 RepID=A0A0S2ISE3_LEPBO|nr:hypothetical protein LBBP_02325 [Leptospira borgpetersenii serovar Ballum]
MELSPKSRTCFPLYDRARQLGMILRFRKTRKFFIAAR